MLSRWVLFKSLDGIFLFRNLLVKVLQVESSWRSAKPCYQNRFWLVCYPPSSRKQCPAFLIISLKSAGHNFSSQEKWPRQSCIFAGGVFLMITSLTHSYLYWRFNKSLVGWISYPIRFFIVEKLTPRQSHEGWRFFVSSHLVARLWITVRKSRAPIWRSSLSTPPLMQTTGGVLCF